MNGVDMTGFAKCIEWGEIKIAFNLPRCVKTDLRLRLFLLPLCLKQAAQCGMQG